MPTKPWLALFTAVSCSALALFEPWSAAAQQAPVFREPFTLKLPVDAQRYYEERFEKAPYFADNAVFLFAGDSFGINVTVSGDEISDVSHQRDVARADVTFKFTIEKAADGKPTMMLVLHNMLKSTLYLDGLMTVPGRKGIYKTRILPVRPGLTNYESWPHPIVQLALRNFRFAPATRE
jgi:hypothetical protein